MFTGRGERVRLRAMIDGAPLPRLDKPTEQSEMEICVPDSRSLQIGGTEWLSQQAASEGNGAERPS